MSAKTFATPAYRTGLFVRVHKKDESEEDGIGPRVRIDFKTSNKLIERFVQCSDTIVKEVRRNLKAKFGDRMQEIAPADVASKHKLLLRNATPSDRYSSAVDLPDFLLKIDDYILQARNCFTICVEGPSFLLNEQQTSLVNDAYSKIWTRLILLGKGHDLKTVWDYDSVERFHEIASEVSDHMRGICMELYVNEVAEIANEGRPTLLETAYTMNAITSGVSPDTFNSVVSQYSSVKDLIDMDRLAQENPLADQPDIDVHLQKLAAHAFEKKVRATCQEGTKPFLKELHAEYGEEGFYKLVSVDDGPRLRAVFLSEIFDKFANFVGIAIERTADEPVIMEYVDGQAGEFTALSSSRANTSINFLTADIAAGF